MLWAGWWPADSGGTGAADAIAAGPAGAGWARVWLAAPLQGVRAPVTDAQCQWASIHLASAFPHRLAQNSWEFIPF